MEMGEVHQKTGGGLDITEHLAWQKQFWPCH